MRPAPRSMVVTVVTIVLVVMVVMLTACGRRESDGGPVDRQLGNRPLVTPKANRTPSGIGGGPMVTAIPNADARSQIARARCAVAVACGGEEMDACVTREEAAQPPLPCTEVDRARLELCVEQARARTCNDSTALRDCAGENLCPKEDQR